MYTYIHIPFCRQKCPYCKFALTPFVQEAKIARYITVLCQEIDLWIASRPNETIRSIYFGGGTPSVLSPKQLETILSRFPLSMRDVNIEIAFEANPEDITELYVRSLKSLGVNRLSLGVQSLSDETLKAVHRSSRATIFDAFDAIERAEFGNVNADFILGLPHAKEGAVLADIRDLHTRYPFLTHTSVYFLEKGDYPKDWKSLGISDTAMTQEYSEIVRYLEQERGFHHYEISNFALPGYESRHNRAYWSHQNVRGFGLSAASYWEGRRFENTASFAGYYRGDVVEDETLKSSEIALESAMFGLRTFSLDPSMITDAAKLDELLAA
ncbi:MAG: coproporphyrinogen-III oxidase family protein [Patescibacteria group bacterium]